MEEKGFFKRHSSLWSVFNSGNSNKFILGKLYLFFRFKPSWNLNKNSDGFTLIELIIVIAILALIAIAAMAILNPFSQFQKARDSRIKSDLSQVQKALEVYYQDKGSYPNSTAGYKILDGTTTINWGSSWKPYMNVVPQDPTSNHNYVYYSLDGQSYYIYANLERGPVDPQACKSGNACASLSTNLISQTACGGTCNFGVSSPNVTP